MGPCVAALVDRTLVAAPPLIAARRFRRRTVVGEKQDQGVLIDAVLFECLANHADAFIHGQQHAAKFFDALLIVGRHPAFLLLFRPLHWVAPHLHRIMNREMRHIEAERMVVMPIDELHRITVDQVGGVAFLRCVDATVPPIVCPVVADMADEIDVAAVIADELVEAVVLRMIVRRVLRIACAPRP